MRTISHLPLVIVAMAALASCQARQRESVVGEWSLSASDVMVLGADGRFRLGGTCPTGGDVTGTWSLKGGRLALLVEHSQSCKMPEGMELVLQVKKVDDWALFAKVPETGEAVVCRRLPARGPNTDEKEKK